jgi:hypothetical protein
MLPRERIQFDTHFESTFAPHPPQQKAAPGTKVEHRIR